MPKTTIIEQMWIELLLFCFVWWMGLHLLHRAGQKPTLYWVAAGLLAYALILALAALGQVVSAELQPILRWQFPLLLAPLTCWIGALWTLRDKLQTTLSQFNQTKTAERNAVGLVLVATLFFTLGLGAILLPFEWLPRRLLIAALSFDLIVLGIAVGWLDAFEQGEAWQPDFIRSLISAELNALLFGGQIALVILVNGITPTLTLLFIGTLATAIALQVFAAPLQTLFDQLVFPRSSQLRSERAELRDFADALPRAAVLVEEQAPQWDEATFAKLTRQALSQMNNLPKLATNPLIELPIIRLRLAQKASEVNTLAKSAELKTLLTESICKLKPHGDQQFDTNRAWRHFNALYFPYVRGLRPNRRQTTTRDLTPTDRAALQWLQTDVPTRTLYNWQKAAAGLISAELWEQLHQ